MKLTNKKNTSLLANSSKIKFKPIDHSVLRNARLVRNRSWQVLS
jgi:hypothetical protein